MNKLLYVYLIVYPIIYNLNLFPTCQLTYILFIILFYIHQPEFSK